MCPGLEMFISVINHAYADAIVLFCESYSRQAIHSIEHTLTQIELFPVCAMSFCDVE